tara:strand:- start:26 stop:454 length:429 start_codon:yes stop_codon:yes gene_type:complete
MHRCLLRVAAPARRSHVRCFAKEAAAPSPSPSPAPAPAPSSDSSSSKSSSSSDRLHSTDIAFKPTEDGWGYSPRYSNNYDAIFGNKKKAAAAPAPAASEPAPAPAEAQMDARDLIALKRILREHSTSSALADALRAEGWVKG